MKFNDLEGLSPSKIFDLISKEVNHDIYYSVYADDFMKLLIYMEKCYLTSGIFKFINKIEYHFKKNEFLNKFYEKDISIKLEIIRDITAIAFNGEDFFTNMDFKNDKDFVNIKTSHNMVFIKMYWTAGLSYIVLLDFYKTKGVISVLENIRILAVDDNDKIVNYKIDLLKFKRFELYDIVIEALDVYMEKVIEHFEELYNKECGGYEYEKTNIPAENN